MIFMRKILVMLAFLVALPAIGATITITQSVSLPGPAEISPDQFYGSAMLDGFYLGGYSALGGGDDFSADFIISAEAYGKSYWNRVGDGQQVDGDVWVEISWVTAPLVFLGGTGDGIAYFNAFCGGSLPYCWSNVDLSTGAFAFTFGVPFQLELTMWTGAAFTIAENVTETTVAYFQAIPFEVTDPDGNGIYAELGLAPVPGPVEAPEPSTWALLATGALAGWGLRRNRRPNP
jgi:hypothetical protein